MVMHLFNSCNKFDVRSGIENNKKDVFEISSAAPHALTTVVAELKRQNVMTGFLKDFVVKEGYPLWDKSIYQKLEKNNPAVFNARGGEEVADTVVYTPIALLDSNFVNGFLLSKVFGDSVELYLYRANDYDLYPYGGVDGSVLTAEFITLKLIELNDAAFGKHKYEIKDSFLFRDFHNGKPNFIRTVIEINLNSSVAGKYALFPACFETVNCWCLRNPGRCDPDKKCLSSGCDRCYRCIEVECNTIALPGGGAGGGSTPNWPPDPPTNPGGGGGNNPPAPTNCTGVNECRPGSQIVEGKVPCGGCGGGPIIVIPPEVIPVNYQSPNWIIFDSSFRALYPCQTTLLDSAQNINLFTKEILYETFNINDEINLKLFHKNLYPDTLTVAENYSQSYVSGVFRSSIRFNTYYLNKSTNEYLLTVYLHESVHAYLGYYKAKLDSGIITLNDFHQKFPLYKPETNSIEMQEHDLMANNYVQKFKNTILSFNPQTPDSVAHALAWSGLQHTNVWKRKSDTLVILKILEDAIEGSPLTLQNYPANTFTKCP